MKTPKLTRSRELRGRRTEPTKRPAVVGFALSVGQAFRPAGPGVGHPAESPAETDSFYPLAAWVTRAPGPLAPGPPPSGPQQGLGDRLLPRHDLGRRRHPQPGLDLLLAGA